MIDEKRGGPFLSKKVDLDLISFGSAFKSVVSLQVKKEQVDVGVWDCACQVW